MHLESLSIKDWRNLLDSSQIRFSRVEYFKTKLRDNLERHFKMTHR
ncbi:MAG: hypothetical protein ACLFSZ_08920 [Puniceicoccaceae bacterium]